MRCSLPTGWEVCSTVGTYFKMHFNWKLCRMKSTKMINSGEINIFRVNWGHSNASQHSLKKKKKEFRAEIIQTIASSYWNIRISRVSYTLQLMPSFKQLLFCFCTCSLNFSSFSNCSLWFFSSCSISFWCFMASYREQGQKCHSWMIIMYKIKGLDLISQTDAGWKTESQ